jgi:hypothetical protein
VPILTETPAKFAGISTKLIASLFNQQPSYNVLVSLIICVGLFLRVYNFWGPPIWVDEYGTWWVVAADTWSEVIERTLKIHGQSPFYYMLVRGVTEIAGYGPFQLRLVSIIFGIAALASIYPLAVKIFENRRVALLSLLIVAVSEPFIWYSQIARPYALALFFGLVSFWSFVALQEVETKILRSVYVLSTALTVYAHYLFGLIVIVQAIYLIVQVGYRRLFSKLWLTTFLAMAMLLLPTISHFLDLHSRRHALDWVTSVDLSWKIANGIIYLIGGSSVVALLAALLSVIVLGFNWAELKRSEIRNKLTLPTIWYIVPFLLFSVLPNLVGVNLGQPRYLLFAYPATYFLLGWFLSNVTAIGYRRWLPATVFITTTIISVSGPALISARTFARWPDRAWNDALAKLGQLYTSDGLVVAQVGLVEADLLTNDGYDPKLLSYLSWPLVSTLPGLKAENIAILPYRLTDRTQIYFRSLLDRAAQYQRIWLVGGGELVSQFHERFVRDFDYKVTTQTDHGEIFHVFVLEKHASSKNASR